MVRRKRYGAGMYFALWLSGTAAALAVNSRNAGAFRHTCKWCACVQRWWNRWCCGHRQSRHYGGNIYCGRNWHIGYQHSDGNSNSHGAVKPTTLPVQEKPYLSHFSSCGRTILPAQTRSEMFVPSPQRKSRCHPTNGKTGNTSMCRLLLLPSGANARLAHSGLHRWHFLCILVFLSLALILFT